MTRLPIVGVLVFAGLAGCARPERARNAVAPTLTRTFVLDGVGAPRADVGVPGRIDHCAYDPATGRLFVAALENGSLEVLDLEKGERVKSIGGLQQPQGLAVVPSTGCAVLACGDGRVLAYDTRTLAERARIELGRGADNVRYDAQADAVYVTHGSTDGGAIAVLDPHTWTTLREVRFASRPESFQLEPQGPRVFANLPEGIRATKDGVVAVVDRNTEQREAEIQLPSRARNFPMALDAEHERLFIACRRPARLIVIDTRRAAVIGEAVCSEDSDDLFYDARTNRVLVIGGGFRPDMQDAPSSAANNRAAPLDETGSIDVFAVGPHGELTKVAETRTAPHARTGLLVPQRRALYVAVPPRDGRPAEIREYRIAD
jgi:DNA-binding beta-propeller fold protein YncE